MITIKHFLLAATVLALSICGVAIAKQPDTHGKKHDKSLAPDARLSNSNKQSKTEDSLRGGERAEERHDINESREHDNKSDNDPRSDDPRYNQYNQQNPVDTIIDSTTDNINQKARELTGGQPRNRR